MDDRKKGSAVFPDPTTSMQLKIRHQNETSREYQEKICKLQREIADLEKENLASAIHNITSLGSKNEFKRALSRLLRNLNSLATDFKEFQETAPQTKQALEDIEKLSGEYDEKIENLLQFMLNENEMLESKQNERFEYAKKVVESFEAKHAQYKTVIHTLQVEEKELIEKGVKADADSSEIQKLISEKKITIDIWIKDCKSLKARNKERKDSLKRKYEKCSVLQEETKTIKSKIQNATEKCAVIKSKIGNLSPAIEDRKASQIKLKKLEEEMEMIKTELQGQKSSEVMTACNELEAEVKNVTTKFRSAQRKLANMPPLPIDETEFNAQYKQLCSNVMALRREQKILLERKEVGEDGAAEMLEVNNECFVQLQQCLQVFKDVKRYLKQQPLKTMNTENKNKIVLSLTIVTFQVVLISSLFMVCMYI